VIDPGGEPAKIIAFLEENQLTPDSIISTHAHADHTGSVAPLVERYDCKFLIGYEDVVSAAEQLEWLKNMLGDFVEPPAPSEALRHGFVVSTAGVEIKILSTPGHTEGSISLYSVGHVFTGDTLFRETIGRFDLSGGDEQQEVASIRNVLFQLPDETVVWPGHGPSTTIGHEKVANRFVR
jgi:glyoxylase-like metal-dependent hydrolase (beta-lactamase superfamily II)